MVKYVITETVAKAFHKEFGDEFMEKYVVIIPDRLGNYDEKSENPIQEYIRTLE